MEVPALEGALHRPSIGKVTYVTYAYAFCIYHYTIHYRAWGIPCLSDGLQSSSKPSCGRTVAQPVSSKRTNVIVTRM